MGFRFRRRLTIMPGVHLNISKKGVSSLSLGRRGATLNIGNRGVKETIGIPGTGLSYTTTSKSVRHRTSNDPSTVQIAESSIPQIDLSRFEIEPRPVSPSRTFVKTAVLAVGILLAFASLVLPTPWGWIALIVVAIGGVIPSRKTLEAAENRRCQELAQTELGSRLAHFRYAVDKGTGTGSSAGLALALQQKLRLTDDEVGRHTVSALRGTVSLSEYESSVSANGGRLPTIAGHESIVSPSECYFATTATYDKRGDNDPSGSLYLSGETLIFVASEGLTSAPWTKVMSVEVDGEVLRVQRRDRQTPYLFQLPSIGDALKAKFIASHVLARTILPPQEIESIPRVPAPAPMAAGTPKRCIDVGTGHGFTMGIVGESYRQTALRALAGDGRARGEEVTFIALLSPEPENAYDPNAIRVDVQDGAQIGYLSREDAVAYRDVLSALSAQQAAAVCRAKLIGGTAEKPSIGAMLDLRAPDEILAILSNAQPF
jgi:hypothetical protein